MSWNPDFQFCMPPRAATSSEVKSKIAAGESVVVKFYSPDCSACEASAPEFQAAACPFHDETEFLEVNVDEDDLLADELGVKSIPVVAAFKGGQLVKKKVGGDNAEAYERFIERFLKS